MSFIMSYDDKYCASCAKALEIKTIDSTERLFCTECSRIVYYDPKVAATAVITRNNKVLLVKRGNEPGYGLWSLPGGYVDRGEIVEEAAAREVLEETGLNVDITKLLGVFSEAGHPVIVVAFQGQEISGHLQTSDETLDINFFSVDELPDLAFPRDIQIIMSWQS